MPVLARCPVCGTPFDPLSSYDDEYGERPFTGRPRQWCSRYCRNRAHYLRLKDEGYYVRNQKRRSAQARARYPQHKATRDRLRDRRRG